MMIHHDVVIIIHSSSNIALVPLAEMQSKKSRKEDYKIANALLDLASSPSEKEGHKLPFPGNLVKFARFLDFTKCLGSDRNDSF